MNLKMIFVRLFCLMPALLLAIGCEKTVPTETENLNMEAVATEITLDWNKTYQEMDGFGIFAGRAVPWFQSRHRDSIMEAMWGSKGLRLNIVRGSLLHEYPFDVNSGRVTVPSLSDIAMSPDGGQYQALGPVQKEQLAQGWLLNHIEKNYDVPIKIASAWSPPMSMRVFPNGPKHAGLFEGIKFPSNPDSLMLLLDSIKTGKKYVANILDPAKRLDYARYIAGFVKAYKEQGIDFYGISPSNEPDNVVSTWTNAPWLPWDLGTFITGNLRPVLNQEGLSKVKIIGPETAGWATTNAYLKAMDHNSIDIYAGHGYKEIMEHLNTVLAAANLEVSKNDYTPDKGWLGIFPNLPSTIEKFVKVFKDYVKGAGKAKNHGDLNTKPTPWDIPTSGKKVWLTEASDDSQQATGADGDRTMKAGIKLATQLHTFLTLPGNGVNAYVYWLAMLESRNNEALVWDVKGSLEFPKTYDVMGHFSRDIKPGYQRFQADNNGRVMVSAYKDPKTGEFTVVIINPSNSSCNATLNLSGFDVNGFTGYQTTDQSAGHWQESVRAIKKSGKWEVSAPPKSLITLVSKKK